MTNQEKIIELAKLDGWTLRWNKPRWEYLSNNEWYEVHQNHDYFTSYDAIIPLVQKMIITDEGMTKVGCALMQVKESTGKLTVLQMTPSEIADALLKAKGYKV